MMTRAASPTPPSGDDTRVVEVRPLDDTDEDAMVEAGVIRDALTKVQRLVAPTPMLDLEVESRRGDAERVLKTSLSRYEYKSPYHDAHQTTLVSAAAALTRALGDGPVGSGFANNGEKLVRDATLLIANAARDALNRDQGELPRLYDIACKLKKDRDEARAAVRNLVLAFGRERRGLGDRQKRRVKDAVAQAKDEAVKETIEHTNGLLTRQQRHEEELALLHMQLQDARAAPARKIQMLEQQLSSECAQRGLDFETHLHQISQLETRVATLDGKVLDLQNKLDTKAYELKRVTADVTEKLKNEQRVSSTAVEHASKCREALGNVKQRGLRAEVFRLWRLRVRMDRDLRVLKKETSETNKRIKSGYEIQIERTQHLCDLAVQRANKRAENAELAATGRAKPSSTSTGRNTSKGTSVNGSDLQDISNSENAGDPWNFLRQHGREKDALRFPVGDAKRVAREKAAIEAAEKRIEKVDAYYERVRKRQQDELVLTKTLQSNAFANHIDPRNASPSASPRIMQSVSPHKPKSYKTKTQVKPRSPTKATLVEVSVAAADKSPGRPNKTRAEDFRDEATAAAAAVLVQGAVARVVLSGEDLVCEGRLVSQSSFDGLDTDATASAVDSTALSVDNLVAAGRLVSQKSQRVPVEELTRTSVSSIPYSTDFDEEVQ